MSADPSAYRALCYGMACLSSPMQTAVQGVLFCQCCRLQFSSATQSSLSDTAVAIGDESAELPSAAHFAWSDCKVLQASLRLCL